MVNGKFPRDEKTRGNLVMYERNCLTLKNPCFIKGCGFALTCDLAIVQQQMDHNVNS